MFTAPMGVWLMKYFNLLFCHTRSKAVGVQQVAWDVVIAMPCLSSIQQKINKTTKQKRCISLQI